MRNLASITLGDLKVLDHWTDAPLGALVQATTRDDKVIVGMRCEMKPGMFETPCLLVLDGDERGSLVAADALGGTALDVSALLEVLVQDPCPRPFGLADHPRFGIVCAVEARPGRLVVRARRSGEGRDCYVFLMGGSADTPPGTVMSARPADLLVLGLVDLAPAARPVTVRVAPVTPELP